ncbi:hypothetical protein [Pseudonocardia sp. T1-2H]|uniref:hypothetical protein n=1 Tax=Pseudonocardia sp. T1-2H TaxID=3128899 RepID=UPI0031012A0C
MPATVAPPVARRPSPVARRGVDGHVEPALRPGLHARSGAGRGQQPVEQRTASMTTVSQAELIAKVRDGK